MTNNRNNNNNKRNENNNSYFQLKNKHLSNPVDVVSRLNNDKMSTAKNGFAAYVAREPQFEKGTIAHTVRQYLARRKSPATISDITEHVMRSRNYKNDNSAQRSVRRVMAQLSNWNVALPQVTEPVSFLLNERSKASMQLN